jgi:hypothetical protein
MYTVGEMHYLPWLTVASHETYTRYIMSIAVQQTVQHLIIKRIAYILLQLRAVAAWAAIRTLGEVKR